MGYIFVHKLLAVSVIRLTKLVAFANSMMPRKHISVLEKKIFLFSLDPVNFPWDSNEVNGCLAQPVAEKHVDVIMNLFAACFRLSARQ